MIATVLWKLPANLASSLSPQTPNSLDPRIRIRFALRIIDNLNVMPFSVPYLYCSMFMHLLDGLGPRDLRKADTGALD